ncbi:MAG TPA: SDR family oxidoreductase [Ramlibacter sp.]
MQRNGRGVVVVTGGSAGLGRAIAREFARQGAHVAVIARERTRLEETRRELATHGVQSVAIEADVADAAQVEAAASRVEQELGPIDIWVNNAMVTMVAPVAQMKPDEFKRISDVTYLGTVWGTMAALRRMRPRNRGTIVQVGSALAYRSIPLQSAYCGAKHAVRGFTESVRTELLHDGSQVGISVVELPGVNTPQFGWCRTTMDKSPQPLGAVYQPEVIARAIAWAARCGRRETYATFASALAIWGDKIVPGLLDRYLSHAAWEGQQSPDPVAHDRPDNLFAPVPGPMAARGGFDGIARSHSASLWATQHRTGLLLGAAALLTLGWQAARARR